jgi:agmatine deiminase
MKTPAEAGYFMPAEWVPHSRCWMAWPVREELWGEHIDEARDVYAEIARAIQRFEPVTMVSNPDSVADVSVMCGGGVASLPLPHDDSWTRDTGPTFVIDGDGGIAGIDWNFNSWGGRYQPYDKDADFARAILDHLDLPRFSAPLVTEGGAINSDGEGTLLAVESSLLDPNRNPNLTRGEVENYLKAYTGCRKVIWLPGSLADDLTKGHVNNVACFVKPGVVVALTSTDKRDENYAPLQANLEILRNAGDAADRSLEVIEIPQPRPFKLRGGGRLTLSYVNFYFANQGIVLPSYDDPADDDAFETFERLFPDHKIVQIPATVIAYGGGGINCITQPQPAV